MSVWTGSLAVSQFPPAVALSFALTKQSQRLLYSILTVLRGQAAILIVLISEVSLGKTTQTPRDCLEVRSQQLRKPLSSLHSVSFLMQALQRIPHMEYLKSSPSCAVDPCIPSGSSFN